MDALKRVVAGILMAASAALPAGAGSDWSYRIVAVAGDVQIVAGGSTRKGAPDQLLGKGDTVVTGKNSFADIAVGEIGMVRVEEQTRLAAASIMEMGADEPSDLELSLGSVLVVLSRLARGGRFEVKTPTQVASVRGTGFQVTADRNGSGVEVMTGEVTVHPVDGGRVVRDIAERVRERQSVRLGRAELRDIISKRRRIAVMAMGDDAGERLAGRFERIRGSRGFDRLNKNVRDEIIERIRKFKRSGDGTRGARKEKIKKIRKQRIRETRGGNR